MGFFPSGAFAQADLFPVWTSIQFLGLHPGDSFLKKGFCLGVFIPVWAFVNCFLNDGFHQGKFFQWGFCPVAFPVPGWDFFQLTAFILWAVI